MNPSFEKGLGLKQKWEEMWNSLREEQGMATRKATLQWSLMRADWNTDDFLMENNFTLSARRDPYLDIRMVEFILSLPALPWLFNKHILRQSMNNHLPDKVLYRPKTPLGYVDHALMKLDQANWVKSWKPGIKSQKYLKDIEFSHSQSSDPIYSNLFFRAIRLDLWLQLHN